MACFEQPGISDPPGPGVLRTVCCATGCPKGWGGRPKLGVKAVCCATDCPKGWGGRPKLGVKDSLLRYGLS
eukprot:4557173-Alexandrium_andersonii.AAC.1